MLPHLDGDERSDLLLVKVRCFMLIVANSCNLLISE